MVLRHNQQQLLQTVDQFAGVLQKSHGELVELRAALAAPELSSPAMVDSSRHLGLYMVCGAAHDSPSARSRRNDRPR